MTSTRIYHSVYYAVRRASGIRHLDAVLRTSQLDDLQSAASCSGFISSYNQSHVPTVSCAWYDLLPHRYRWQRPTALFQVKPKSMLERNWYWACRLSVATDGVRLASDFERRRSCKAEGVHITNSHDQPRVCWTCSSHGRKSNTCRCKAASCLRAKNLANTRPNTVSAAKPTEAKHKVVPDRANRTVSKYLANL